MVGRVLVNHMTALAAAAPQMSLDQGLASVRAALVLVEQALLGSGRFTRDQTRAAYAGIRKAAGVVIDQRLKDPDFGVGDLVSSLGVSRATLFRAFAEAGGVNSTIQLRRLQGARAVLIKRVGRQPTVAEIAHSHGFVSESHFSRLFSAAYGEAPGNAGAVCLPEMQDAAWADMRYDVILDWMKGAELPALD